MLAFIHAINVCFFIIAHHVQPLIYVALIISNAHVIQDIMILAR